MGEDSTGGKRQWAATVDLIINQLCYSQSALLHANISWKVEVGESGYFAKIGRGVRVWAF